MVPITDAKYEKVRDECLADDKLWKDPDFPADETSIGPIGSIEGDVVWMRPHDICAIKKTVPHFIVDEGDRFDIVQGKLGDCWMLASLAALTTRPQLFTRTVPTDQTFESSKKYAGVFRFHFWKYSKWVEVLVDDRLPTVDGKLLFAKTSPRGEFWVPLLEKAYAKFYCNYAVIEGGFCREAIKDFTGCIAQDMDIIEYSQSKLLKLLTKAIERKAILSASVFNPENAKKMGIITGHAYSITGVKKVTLINGSQVDLIRIRNPWGDHHEWKGRWSDASEEWNNVLPHQLNEMRMETKADGEYWMLLSDFQQYFCRIDLCYLDTTDNLDNPDEGPKCWFTSTFYGKWIVNETNGGWNIHSPSYCKNPQYEITVKDCDDDDDKASFLVELTQMSRRWQGLYHLEIAFRVYCILPGVQFPLSKDYLEDSDHIVGDYKNRDQRSIVKSFTVNPGRYAIIPSTFNTFEFGEFMIRVFSESEHQLNQIN